MSSLLGLSVEVCFNVNMTIDNPIQNTEKFLETNSNNPPPAEQKAEPVSNDKPKKKHKNILLILIIFFLFCVVSASAYFVGVSRDKNVETQNLEQKQETTTVATEENSLNKNEKSMLEQELNAEQDIDEDKIEPKDLKDDHDPVTVQSPKKESQLLSGELKLVDQDLHLFKLTESDKLNEVKRSGIYYEAGHYIKGQYEGYTRIVAIRGPRGLSKPHSFILATKDFVSYILDDPEQKTINYDEDHWNNPYDLLDKSKIAKATVLPGDQPLEISLDNKFSLYRDKILLDYVETGEKDKYGNSLSRIILANDFFDYEALSSPDDYLSMYFEEYWQDDKFFANYSAEQKQAFKVRDEYYQGWTEVVVLDSVGVPMIYSLTTKNNIAQYQRDKSQFFVDFRRYEDLKEKFENDEIEDYPKMPDYVSVPALGVQGDDISSSVNNFYDEYETAFPQACSSSLRTRTLNVNDEDLEPIGTVNGLTLYQLKDENHPLLYYAFDAKIGPYQDDIDYWEDINGSVKVPSFEEYTAKHPLLFFKDYWDRWVAIGEFDYLLPGGCGKPVIYLYPEETTAVSVNFTTPVQLTTDIPSYKDGWLVEANPDGSLKDLQPEFTQCDQFTFSKFGSEYAQAACETNNYPYLYWSGNVSSSAYPKMEKGWIVKRSNLNHFFSDKLTAMGLNKQEKFDFMEYWVPELLSKKAAYYRLSFLQTQQLNQLFPMQVDPQPYTVFRIFLDYTALAAKPEVDIQPQQLESINRTGFTLVEWGGLKQY